MSSSEIAKRLTAIEQDLAELKAQRSNPATIHPIHALERIHATFENDEAFQEAMRLGRKWRNSDKPAPRKSKVKRK